MPERKARPRRHRRSPKTKYFARGPEAIKTASEAAPDQTLPAPPPVQCARKCCTGTERCGGGTGQAPQRHPRDRQLRATQIKVTIEEAGLTTRQLLEDVQASLHNSISGEAILKCYTEETRQQFAAVIRTIIELNLSQALAASQKQMDGWLKGALEGAIRNAKDALAAVTRDFRVKLLGAWSYLLWSIFAGGLLCGFGLLFLGYWLGKHLYVTLLSHLLREMSGFLQMYICFQPARQFFLGR